jgi:hypothetical protein
VSDTLGTTQVKSPSDAIGCHRHSYHIDPSEEYCGEEDVEVCNDENGNGIFLEDDEINGDTKFDFAPAGNDALDILTLEVKN